MFLILLKEAISKRLNKSATEVDSEWQSLAQKINKRFRATACNKAKQEKNKLNNSKKISEILNPAELTDSDGEDANDLEENGDEEFDSDSGSIKSTEFEESDDDEGENEPLCIDENNEEEEEEEKECFEEEEYDSDVEQLDE